MPRPPKWRRVDKLPGFTYFKPSGVPMKDLSDIILSVEEFEAIRLRDLLDMEHSECADRMHVSRPTFHRILSSARQKIASALVNGSALRIEGGNYQLASHKLACQKCGHQWEGTICRRHTMCPSCCTGSWKMVDRQD